MKKILLNLIATLYFIVGGFALHAQTIDSIVNVLPKWKMGDAHTMKIKVSTTDEVNGTPKTFTSTYKAIFKIIDVSSDSYVGEWEYTDANVVPTDPLAENHVIAALLNIKINIKLFRNGAFESVINGEEVKDKALQLLKKLETINTTNQTMLLQINLAKKTLGSSEGLELLLKQIKLYFMGYGNSFSKYNLNTRNLQTANIFGGKPFDVVEKTQIINIGENKKVFEIKSDRKVDGVAVKAAVKEYLKKVSPPERYAEIERQLGNANLDFSEKSLQQYQISTGVIQKTSFIRIMKLGIQNRTMLWEIETTD